MNVDNKTILFESIVNNILLNNGHDDGFESQFLTFGDKSDVCKRAQFIYKLEIYFYEIYHNTIKDDMAGILEDIKLIKYAIHKTHPKITEVQNLNKDDIIGLFYDDVMNFNCKIPKEYEPYIKEITTPCQLKSKASEDWVPGLAAKMLP